MTNVNKKLLWKKRWTQANFDAWLDTLPPTHHFSKSSARHCPIAQWLSYVERESFGVTRSYVYEHKTDKMYASPKWVVDFTREFDHLNGSNLGTVFLPQVKHLFRKEIRR